MFFSVLTKKRLKKKTGTCFGNRKRSNSTGVSGGRLSKLGRGDVGVLASSHLRMDVRCLTRVAVREQRADGEEDFRDGEGRTPVVLQDVQANHTLAVNVTVIDSRPEGNLEEQGKLS